jgi:serine/threonine-protein kinase/endoribonuclease IRE1
MKDAKDLSGVERFGEEGTEAKDLITRMLDPDPTQRLVFCLFWF